MAENLDAPITLDQLRVFLSVVEAGSFSKAAKQLRRVQSAVSYSIANLERLLDVELFDRSGRTPVLTDAGRALLADVRAVENRVDRLHARARSLAAGVEARLSLAVDMLFPLPGLLEGLSTFSERFEGVDLHLRTEALGAVTQLVLDGICQIGIGVDLEPFPHTLTTRPLTTIEMVPVCAKDHALAGDDPLEGDDLRDEVQIVVTDRSALTEGQDRGVLSERTWRVADLETKRAMIAAGFGWGLMPAHRVRAALEAGELARLSVTDWDVSERRVPLHAIWRTADPPGPAGTWLLEQLADRCAETGR
jgi:DNA-binding transcriptional LysR family regulator